MLRGSRQPRHLNLLVKRTTSTDYALSASNNLDDDYWDALDAKDVYFIDDSARELEITQKVPAAFEKAGYEICTWSKASTHPVWILNARRKSAPRFADYPQFIKHVIDVLRSASVRARRAEVTVGRNGDTIIVSLLWPLGVRAWRFDESSGWEPDPFTT
jgi:hypothetical protein